MAYYYDKLLKLIPYDSLRKYCLAIMDETLTLILQGGRYEIQP